MELHHHARRAVATLSAPVSGQTLLYGVVALAPAAQPLHGRHLPALADVDGCQAAVDGPGPAPLRLGDGDYTGPTAALTARHLRPGEQRHLADVLSQAELRAILGRVAQTVDSKGRHCLTSCTWRHHYHSIQTAQGKRHRQTDRQTDRQKVDDLGYDMFVPMDIGQTGPAPWRGDSQSEP